MITIRDWQQYEVDSKGHAWQPGEPLRKKPLEYIRVAAHGGHWTPSYRDLLEKGGRDAAAALGVFTKLLELSARQPADLRGGIWERTGQPASVEYLAKVTGFPVDVITKTLGILTAAGWIAMDDKLPEFPKFPETPESPGIPQIPGCFLKGKERVKKEKGNNAPSGASPLVDPLADLPELAAFYPALWGMITEAHPKADTPKEGSKAEHDARRTLARLVHRDGFTQEEITQALTWLFEAEHKDAVFWRGQVGAIEPLRKRGRSGLMKMAAIHECWKKTTGAHQDTGECWTDEKAAQFERELAREGGA